MPANEAREFFLPLSVAYAPAVDIPVLADPSGNIACNTRRSSRGSSGLLM